MNENRYESEEIEELPIVIFKNIKFKKISYVEGGSFNNKEGEKITYSSKYKVLVDYKNGKQTEFKFETNKKELFNKFNSLKQYQSINLICTVKEIRDYKQGYKVEIVDIEIINEN